MFYILNTKNICIKTNGYFFKMKSFRTSILVKHDPFANATKQVNDACDIIGIKDKELREYLAMPNKVLRVKIPVKMDNGEVEVFRGYRVQHNSALGPYKGGLRYHPTVDIDAARALEEGTINSVAEANVGSILGWNFAPFKGGVFQYINDYGINDFVKRAKQFEQKYGSRFTLPEIILAKAKQNELF